MRKFFVLAMVVVLAACGGDDGDTIVSGSEDAQARDSIAAQDVRLVSVESEIVDIQSKADGVEVELANHESRVSDLESDLGVLNDASAPIIKDDSGVVLGRVLSMGLGLPADHFDSVAVPSGITSKGFIFYIRLGLEQVVQGPYITFESTDCTGQAFIRESALSQDNPAYSQGGVLNAFSTEGRYMFHYFLPNPTSEPILAASNLNPVTEACGLNSPANNEIAYKVYPNDPVVTGFPSSIVLPVKIE